VAAEVAEVAAQLEQQMAQLEARRVLAHYLQRAALVVLHQLTAAVLLP
jgi:hypothetical protein